MNTVNPAQVLCSEEGNWFVASGGLPEPLQGTEADCKRIAAALNAQLPVRVFEYGSREHADKLSAEIAELRETLEKAKDAYSQGVAAGRSEALNAQAGVVEALRPLEVELEKLDDATERDSTPEMVGATWRLIEAARAGLASVKGVES